MNCRKLILGVTACIMVIMLNSTSVFAAEPASSASEQSSITPEEKEKIYQQKIAEAQAKITGYQTNWAIVKPKLIKLMKDNSRDVPDDLLNLGGTFPTDSLYTFDLYDFHELDYGNGHVTAQLSTTVNNDLGAVDMAGYLATAWTGSSPQSNSSTITMNGSWVFTVNVESAYWELPSGSGWEVIDGGLDFPDQVFYTHAVNNQWYIIDSYSDLSSAYAKTVIWLPAQLYETEEAKHLFTIPDPDVTKTQSASDFCAPV
jgi:hypothetical protein